MVHPKSYAIGIDLGAANTRTAIFRNGQPELIPHEGLNLMPSCVAFRETSYLVGSAAQSQASMNAKNTIQGALRFIGRKFNEPFVKRLISQAPFQVVKAEGRPVFAVEYQGKQIHVTPVEVMAMILVRVRQDAKSYLGLGDLDVLQAVISVPAYFTVGQRQAIHDAAFLADLSVCRLVSRVASSCMDLVFLHKEPDFCNIMVIDFGAGSLEVGIVCLEENVADLLALAYDADCGGSDLDANLLRTLSYPIKNARAHRRLLTACESVKKELSSQEHASIQIDQLYEGHDVSKGVDRSELETICQAVFHHSISAVISRTLQASRRVGEDIALDSVILMGGSSRIQKIRSMVAQHIPSVRVSKILNPDEAVVRGAAILAAKIAGASQGRIDKILLLDVWPRALGIEVKGGEMYPISKSNACIPSRVSGLLEGLTPGQSRQFPILPVIEGEPDLDTKHAVYQLSFYEGDELRAEDNKCIGVTKLLLHTKPDQTAKIAIDLNIDANGKIVASANNERGPESTPHLVLEDPNRFSLEELASIRSRVRQFQVVADEEERRITMKHHVEEYILSFLAVLKTRPQDKLNQDRESLAKGMLNWLDTTPNATAEELLRVNGILRSTAKAFEHELIETADDKSEKEEGVAASTDDIELTEEKEVVLSTVGPTKDIASSRHTPQNLSQHIEIPKVSDQASPLSTSRDTLEDYANISMLNSTVSSSSLSVTSPDLTGANNPRASTPQRIERTLTELFTKTENGWPEYSDTDFTHIGTYLNNKGRPAWSRMPRIYTVLRLINQLEMADAFADEGITDIWLPFTSASLPTALSPTARAKFIEHQNLVLSKALRFETDLGRRHAHFKDEEVPFEVVASLGAGAHGQVHKVISTISGREYARKRFRKNRNMANKKAISSFLVELQTLKKINHRHCIELVQSYADSRYFALLMGPVGDCNLEQFYDIAHRSADKRSLLRTFFGCLASAVQYLHEIKIRHRDIKPQNIIVKGDQVFLTDFGIALDWEHLSRSTTTADSGKTPVYAAPEVARYEKRNSSADVWSLGCVFFEMATVLKLETLTAMRSFFTERNGSFRFFANIDSFIAWSSVLEETGVATDNVLLRWTLAMLSEDAALRPPAAQLYEDIVRECKINHATFCASCCLDEEESEGFEDDDEDDAWEQAAESLTLDALVL